ncbi:MAG: NAD+ synthase [Chlamydiae bacterium]|nr:NAD+ synthase [Chlamydiota bacterium]
MLVFVAQLNPIIGDLKGNTDKILEYVQKAKQAKVDVVLFSESVIAGYPSEDLLLYNHFIEELEKQLERVVEASKDLFIVVGTVRKAKGKEKGLYNTAAVICNQKLLGYKDKTLLPTYNVFDERRYFEPGEEEKVWEYKGKKIGVSICEDVWEHANEVKFTRYAKDPVLDLKKLKPDILLNLSGSPYYYQKLDLRLKIFAKTAQTLKCPVIMCNQVGGNDQLVFDGYSFWLDSNGKLIRRAKGFAEDSFIVDTEEKKETVIETIDPLEDLYKALVLGIKDYFRKLKLKKACLGLSGGIDSALALCIAVDALGAENVLAINMPSRFSSLQGIEDSKEIAENLKVELMDIPIDHMFQDFLNLLSPIFYGKPFSEAEENLQARIRGTILMAISNKLGYIVLSTGNKSEMAMGYMTLYGDMCGGLDVLLDVSKLQVYELSKWINRKKEIIPDSIIQKPPSAELRANQKDQDTLPPYEIVDAVLEGYVEDHLSSDQIINKFNLKPEIVKELIERIHLAEYKRRQGPPGIIVTKKSFTKGRFFPIAQGWKG